MAQKMTGALVFDERTDRYDIRFDLNSYYGGLHCGECFDVSCINLFSGQQRKVRLLITTQRFTLRPKAEAFRKRTKLY